MIVSYQGHLFFFPWATDVELCIFMDSKDLYASLSTQRQSIDTSVRAEVNNIRCQFEVGNADRILWLSGRFI